MAREPIPERAARDEDPGNDFVAKIVEDPSNPPQTLLLSGYIGTASVPDHTRLYLDPELSDYVDIPQDAILHVAHRPREQGPLRGSYLWIKRDAELLHAPATTARRRGTFLEGRMQRAFDAAAGAAAPAPSPVSLPAAQCPLPTLPPAACGTTQIGVLCQHTAILQVCQNTQPIICHDTLPAICNATLSAQCTTHLGLLCQQTSIQQICHPTLPAQCQTHVGVFCQHSAVLVCPLTQPANCQTQVLAFCGLPTISGVPLGRGLSQRGMRYRFAWRRCSAATHGVAGQPRHPMPARYDHSDSVSNRSAAPMPTPYHACGWVPDPYHACGWVPDSDHACGWVPDSDHACGWVPDPYHACGWVPDDDPRRWMRGRADHSGRRMSGGHRRIPVHDPRPLPHHVRRAPVYLTTRNLADYLIEIGLLDRNCVVQNSLMIANASRRSRNFKVRCGGSGLFVKQIASWNAQSMELIRREAACYRLAQNDRRFPGLGDLAPRFVHHDETRHVLIVELLPGAENLTERYVRLGTFPIEVAAMLGRTLGSYHRHKDQDVAADSDLAIFPRGLPWILTISELPEQHQSAAASELVRMIKSDGEFGKLMTALRPGWRTKDLIHGDMKWDNCVVYQDSDATGQCLRVVDWELADFGDACWDVGGIFQSYLSFWAVTLRAAPGDTAERIATSGPYSLDAMQPAIRTFWHAYAGHLGLNPSSEREWLDQSLRYAAARMVQTAYEHAVNATSLTAEIVRLLQMSFNILNRPRDAARDLLGFT